MVQADLQEPVAAGVEQVDVAVLAASASEAEVPPLAADGTSIAELHGDRVVPNLQGGQGDARQGANEPPAVQILDAHLPTDEVLGVLAEGVLGVPGVGVPLEARLRVRTPHDRRVLAGALARADAQDDLRGEGCRFDAAAEAQVITLTDHLSAPADVDEDLTALAIRVEGEATVHGAAVHVQAGECDRVGVVGHDVSEVPGWNRA